MMTVYQCWTSSYLLPANVSYLVGMVGFGPTRWGASCGSSWLAFTGKRDRSLENVVRKCLLNMAGLWTAQSSRLAPRGPVDPRFCSLPHNFHVDLYSLKKNEALVSRWRHRKYVEFEKTTTLKTHITSLQLAHSETGFTLYQQLVRSIGGSRSHSIFYLFVSLPSSSQRHFN